jgi:hypothetical protein
MPAISIDCSLFVASDQEAAVAGPLELTELEAVAAEVPALQPGCGGGAVGRSEDQVPSGAEDAGDLGDAEAVIEDGYQVEVVVGEWEMPRVAGLEGDAALRIEPDARIRLSDHLFGAIDPAHPSQLELPGEEERALAVPALQVENALWFSDVQDCDCEWG